MPPHNAPRNRTLTVRAEEKPLLLPLLTTAHDLSAHRTSSDLLVCADLLAVIDQIPDEIADLVIIDPPYNLTKDFHGRTFTARSEQAYEEYLHSWFPKVFRKLKPDGSLYLCGDWKCTSALQRVMSEELTVLNRITWQREKVSHKQSL